MNHRKGTAGLQLPKTKFRLVQFLSGILTATSAFAASISVPNGSFELQVAGPPLGVDTRIDNWQKGPRPIWFDEGTFGFAWDQTAGVFANTPIGMGNHIDNMDGNQANYMLNFPEVSLFQDYESTDWAHASPLHAFDATFEAGKSYQLTLGAIGGGGGMTNGVILLGLYYRDNNNAPVTIGSTPIVYDPQLFPSTTHFVDFTVNLPEVLAADAWAGKHIGIEIISIGGSGVGYWDLDNVRLLSIVPEPSTGILLALGLGGWLVRRARSRTPR